MNTVDVIIQVPKETKEAGDAMFGIIADVKAKKTIAEIVAGNLPKLISAVEGFDQMDDEFKSAHRSALVAYLVKGIMDALLPVAPSA